MSMASKHQAFQRKGSPAHRCKVSEIVHIDAYWILVWLVRLG